MAANPNLPDWFFKSYIPSTHSVLGRKLEPLSLNHLLHLNAIDSPFLNDPNKATLADVINGVLICSTRLPETNLDHLEARLNPTKYSVERSLGSTPYPCFSSIPKWKRQAIKLQKKFPKLEAVERVKFNEYIDRSCTTAKTHKDDRAKKTVPLPWIQHYIVTLARGYNWPRNVILNLSYAEATTHILSIQYHDYGHYSVITAEEAEAIEFVKSLGNVDELVKQQPQRTPFARL